MPWMYDDSPDMERQLPQRHWRALAHWKPANRHLPLAVFLAVEPIGMQDLWGEGFAQRRPVGTGSPGHPTTPTAWRDPQRVRSRCPSCTDEIIGKRRPTGITYGWVA